jgi:hypothetical protein
VPKLAGALLLVTGSYVAYYGWWEIRVLDGGAVDDPVISSAQDIQVYAAQLVNYLGPSGLTVILVALVLITLGLRALRRRAQHHQAAT